ncbi:hypothetical protein Tco_1370818 [Tanacetum coccineum]
MSTSKTYQQSLADAGSETRSPMLERGSYIPWASRFRRYLNRKRDNRKWLLKELDEGPYEFKNFVPEGSTIPRLQTAEDLEGDDLLLHDAEMEVMNMILLSIPNEIYNSVDACTSAKDMWKRVERLMRGTIQNKVDRETRFMNEFDQFVAEPGVSLVSVYNRFAQLMNDLEINNMNFPTVTINTKFLNSLQPEWLKYLLAKAITQKFSNPTNNRLRASSNTRNQAIIQGDRVNIQSRNSGNTGRNGRRAYVQEEVVEGMNAPKETGNVQRTLRIPSSGNTSTDEAGVILIDEQNDFLFASHPPKLVPSDYSKLELLHMDLCSPMRVASINEKKYILVIFDELTAMASEHDCLESEIQRFNNHNSSEEQMNTPSKEDLDNLFGPMFEEYYEQNTPSGPYFRCDSFLGGVKIGISDTGYRKLALHILPQSYNLFSAKFASLAKPFDVPVPHYLLLAEVTCYLKC